MSTSSKVLIEALDRGLTRSKSSPDVVFLVVTAGDDADVRHRSDHRANGFDERRGHVVDHLLHETRIDAEKMPPFIMSSACWVTDDAVLDVLVGGLAEIAAEEPAMADLALVEVAADPGQSVVIRLCSCT